MIRLFKHYISHAVFLVGVLDVVLLYLAGDLSWRLRAEQIGMDPGSIADRFWQLAGQAGVMLPCCRVGMKPLSWPIDRPLGCDIPNG